MRSFKFKYSVIAKIILILALVACFTGLLWNIFNLVWYASSGLVKILSYSLITLLIAICIFIILSMIFHSLYKVKDNILICTLGIFKNTYELSRATDIIWYTVQDKLVIYFENGKYTVIVIDQNQFLDFVDEVRNVNKKIIFNKEDKDNSQRT